VPSCITQDNTETRVRYCSICVSSSSSVIKLRNVWLPHAQFVANVFGRDADLISSCPHIHTSQLLLLPLILDSPLLQNIHFLHKPSDATPSHPRRLQQSAAASSDIYCHRSLVRNDSVTTVATFPRNNCFATRASRLRRRLRRPSSLIDDHHSPFHNISILNASTH